MKKIMNYGLNPTPPDSRDDAYALGAIVGQINITEVPNESWDFSNLTIIKDQKESDYCGGFSSAAVSEDQELTELCPVFSFAAAKYIQGNPDEYGTDLRSIAQGHRKVGALEEKDCPIKDDHFNPIYRVLENWPDYKRLLKKAQIHKKKTFVWTHEGRYDTFDNIRAALWQFRDQHQAIETGVAWRENWTYAPGGVVPKEPGQVVGGHAIKIAIRQKMINGESYLVMPNSYGKGVGDKGLFYFPREVVNRDFTYGAFNMPDLETINTKGTNVSQLKSNLFELNWRDAGKGLLVAVISAVLTYAQQLFSEHGLAITPDDLKMILSVAMTAGIGYLIKNYFEDKDGNNQMVETIGGIFKIK